MSRLADIMIGLQRVAEHAQMRSEDIRSAQAQETYEHIQWLDQQLAMVEKVRAALLTERKKFIPVEKDTRVSQEPMPRIAQKGPANG